MAEPVPVTTLTTQELELFEPGGTVAEQLDALPQFFRRRRRRVAVRRCSDLAVAAI